MIGTEVTNDILYGGENTYMLAYAVDENLQLAMDDGELVRVAPEAFVDPETGLPITAVYAFDSPWGVYLGG